MSGSVVVAEVTPEPIDPRALLEAVADPGHGATLLFLGTVRNSAPGEGEDRSSGRPVTGITYQAYDAMARTVLAEIAAEALECAGGGRIALVHRTGALELGETSVAIAVATPHRAEAYEANRYVIEQIKRRLPVWKHEHYADGGEGWVTGVALEPAGSDEGAAESP